jgi:hypothetical protein
MITAKISGHVVKCSEISCSCKRSQLTGPLLVQLHSQQNAVQRCNDMVADPAAVMLKVLNCLVPVCRVEWKFSFYWKELVLQANVMPW